MKNNRRLMMLGTVAALGVAGLAGVLGLRRGKGPPFALPDPLPEAEYMAALRPLSPPTAPLATYHLGHSLVGRDMPAMLSQLVAAAFPGATWRYASQLGWGAALRAHWLNEVPGFEQENASPAFRPAREAIASGDYDAVVFTEMVELKDAIQWHHSAQYLAEWTRAARTARPDVRVYLYETWHQLDDKAGWLERIDADLPALWEGEIIRRAMSVDGVGPIYLIPGGQALAAVTRAAEGGFIPGLTRREELFALNPDGTQDNIHFNDKGAYLIALTHFATLYGRSPEGLPHALMRADGTPADALSAEGAAAVQALIWALVQTLPQTGVPG